MTEQKKLDIYFRVNLKDEKGTLQKATGNYIQNILHAIIMEIEKPGTQYNRFRKEYEIEFFTFTEEDKKMNLLKTFKFEQLGAKDYGQKPSETK